MSNTFFVYFPWTSSIPFQMDKTFYLWLPWLFWGPLYCLGLWYSLTAIRLQVTSVWRDQTNVRCLQTWRFCDLLAPWILILFILPPHWFIRNNRAWETWRVLTLLNVFPGNSALPLVGSLTSPSFVNMTPAGLVFPLSLSLKHWINS